MKLRLLILLAALFSSKGIADSSEREWDWVVTSGDDWASFNFVEYRIACIVGCALVADQKGSWFAITSKDKDGLRQGEVSGIKNYCAVQSAAPDTCRLIDINGESKLIKEYLVPGKQGRNLLLCYDLFYGENIRLGPHLYRDWPHIVEQATGGSTKPESGAALTECSGFLSDDYLTWIGPEVDRPFPTQTPTPIPIPTPAPTPTPASKLVPASSGTGFFVSQSGHVITNNHVIDECKAVKVSFDGNEVDANLLAVDRYNDLAILRTTLKPNAVFPVSGEDAALLDDVVIAGFPLGRDVSSAIKTSKGSVTSLAGYGDNYSEFQTDAALNQGNSGGPIMNQKGNVVGVAVSAYGKDEGVESFNFGIKASTLKTFARSNNLNFLPPNNRELSNSELGQLITDATLYLECWMTVAQIKKLIAQEGNRKAFFSEYQ